MMMSKDNSKRISTFIALCYMIAEYIDYRGESGDNFTIDAFGLGYAAASNKIRNGIMAVIELNYKLHNQYHEAKIAKMHEKDMRDFLFDIFGEEEVESVNDEIKAEIKEAVKKILKEWENTHDNV